MQWLRWAVLLALLALNAPSQVARGQSPLDPGQLPKGTTFYFSWHGMPAGDVRKANSLLALWDDTDFAPVRTALLDEMEQSSSKKSKSRTPLTQAEITEFVSLLDNELIVGNVAEPSAAKSAAAAGEASARKWNGAFLVFDRTGKESTLAKLLLRARTSETDPPKISTETLAGLSTIKVESKSGASYWAEAGKYALSASEPAVFEQIAAWTKSATREGTGLSETVGYREASGVLKGGVAEFFFHFPAVNSMTGEDAVAGFRLKPLVQNLKIDSVHAIAVRISLDGAKTKFTGAILGDAAPGTPFDIWDDGATAPVSGAFISANTVSYQEGRLNLAGVYGLIKHALQSTVAAGQQSPMDFIEMGAKTRLGTSIPEALGLFSGEFASLQLDATLDPAKRVYVVGIKRKPETLKLLRAAFADRVVAERNEGDTTFLKVSEGGIHSSAGTASWKYYHLAVKADTILISSRLESLKETLAVRNVPPLAGAAASDTGSLPAPWQAARGQFPKSLDGLGFVDFQRIDWTAVKDRWDMESRKPGSKAAAGSTTHGEQFGAAVRKLDPQVLSRHLHLSANGSWKDAQGVHFDGWIE